MEKDGLREFVKTSALRRSIKLAVLLIFFVVLCIPWLMSQSAVRAERETGAAASATHGGKNSCVECHAQMGDQLAAPIAAIQDDVHARRGLSCADCHGGDPAQDDPKRAMNPQKGFVARPKPADVPRFCGKCHSNAELMKKFNPAIHVDQEAEYYTSVHGKLVKQGDQKPATCISCHGFHGVKAVSDPNAPVYPLNVAQTCGKCHSSAEYMKNYSIATDQLQKYGNSVHAEALLKKQDLSAPTCNDCHGNHGATPPGVTSVANVCGACHTRQPDLFQKSPHKAPFEAVGIAGCVVCHSNHEIHAPTDEMLGVNEKATCVSCHTEGDAGYQAAQRMRGRIDELQWHIDQARQQLNRAAYAGMEVSRPLFDLKDSEDKLINARVVIHSFSPDELDGVVNPGLQTSIKAHQEGDDALAELQFRRKGLAASLVIIFLAGAAIYLKIRQLKHSKQ
jgi:predicted CXXCH cytochrome family protein